MTDVTMFKTAVIASAAFLLTLAYVKSRRPRRAPPGPFVWPFVGNLFDVTGTKTFHLKANELYKKYGPLTSLQIAFYPAVLVSDLQILKRTLVQSDMFADRPIWLPFYKYLMLRSPPGGVAFVNGETQVKNNKLTHAALRNSEFGLESKIMTEVVFLLEELESVEGQEYSFGKKIKLATANVIGSVLYGKRYEYSDKEFTSFVENNIFILSKAGLKNPCLFLPTVLLPLIPLLLSNIAGSVRAIRGHRKFTTDQIEEHKATFDAKVTRDLIDLGLQAGMTDEDLRLVLFDMIMAGSETLSSILSWALLFMIRNPDIQDKCRQEILQNVGSDRLPSLKDKPALLYTCATIMEIQRMASVAAVFPHHNCRDSIELGGYLIPKDTLIFVNYYSINMDPKNWAEPEKFKPERFLSEDKQTIITPNAFIPYGLGKRACLGESLGRKELFLFFSAFLQKFQFRAVDPNKLPRAEDCSLGGALVPDDYTFIVSSV